MTRPVILLTTFLLTSVFSKSQNLTGTWEGSAMGEYYKLVIIQVKDSLFGYTYDTGMGYCKADFVGTYDSTTKKLNGKNTEFIARTLTHSKSVYSLTWSKEGGTEWLRGRVAPKSLGARIASFGIGSAARYTKIKSTIDTTKFLARVLSQQATEKTNAADKKTVDQKADTLAVVNKDSTLVLKNLYDSIAAVKESRRSVVQKTISTAADTVKITLYDDGDIDGDIVTIFDNGKIIANKLLLTKEPYYITLLLPNNGSKHTIELMAENEGAIPPNTAYMLVVAGTERVEVKASSDKLSNAAIVIQKEE
jgi:archaellum component FlaF (FlaF/FlaG flagellin family)